MLFSHFIVWFYNIFMSLNWNCGKESYIWKSLSYGRYWQRYQGVKMTPSFTLNKNLGISRVKTSSRSLIQIWVTVDIRATYGSCIIATPSPIPKIVKTRISFSFSQEKENKCHILIKTVLQIAFLFSEQRWGTWFHRSHLNKKCVSSYIYYIEYACYSIVEVLKL